MKFLFSLIIFNLFILSCTSEAEAKRNNDIKLNEIRKVEIAKENKIIKDSLNSRYSIRFSWDTLHFDYSYDYKQIIESKYQLIEDGELNDIYEQDSTIYASIWAGVFPSFHFDLRASKEQVKLLKSKDKKIFIVVSISELKKFKYIIEAKPEDSESAQIDISYSFDFFGKGKIIDIVTMPKK